MRVVSIALLKSASVGTFAHIAHCHRNTRGDSDAIVHVSNADRRRAGGILYWNEVLVDTTRIQ